MSETFHFKSGVAQNTFLPWFFWKMSTPNHTSANIRRPSIAERASAAMEAGLGEIESRLSTISRRKSLNASSKELIVEEQYSMVPDDYELIQPIG
jgi:hypothetical protein